MLVCGRGAPSSRIALTFKSKLSFCGDGPSNQIVPLVWDQRMPALSLHFSLKTPLGCASQSPSSIKGAKRSLSFVVGTVKFLAHKANMPKDGYSRNNCICADRLPQCPATGCLIQTGPLPALVENAIEPSGRQSLNNPAFGDCAAAALIDHAVEFPPQGTQVGDLSIDLGPMFLGDDVDGVAGPIALVRQFKQRANLVEREPEVARAPDEAQPIEVFGSVGAVIAGRPGRCRKELDPFIIADGLDLGVRPASQLADCQVIFRHALDP